MAMQNYTVTLQDLIKNERKKRVLVCHKAPLGGWTVCAAQFLPDGESYVWLFERSRASYATYPEHWQSWSTKKIPALSEPLDPRY